MDTGALMTNISIGFGLGLTTMLVITVVMIPVSYAMNKFVYHGPVMRLMLGVLAAIFSVVGFIVISGMFISGQLKPVHYFGLAPLIKISESPIEPTGYLAFLFKILSVFVHPISMFYTEPGDVTGFEHNIRQVMVSDAVTEDFPWGDGTVKVTKGAVSEAFSLAVNDAAAIAEPAEWSTKMATLSGSGISQFIFT